MATTVGPAPGSAPWEAWPDCEHLTFTNPAGETVELLMLAGAQGRLMPPVVNHTMPVPAQHGSRYLASAHKERMVTVPTVFPGSITDRDELRRWSRVLDPSKGEGTLAVVAGPHAGRTIRCVYDAGLDDLAEVYPGINEGTLLFRAAWPYWTDGQESSFDIAQGESATTWFPFLPLVLGASDAFASFVIDNLGDVPAWPVVTVNGPGSQLTVENLTTAEGWTFSGDLVSGDVLTVDTRPGQKTVVLNGTNAFPRLTVGSKLWPLVPGPNRVEVAMALTDPTALVKFGWRNQWLSA